MIRSLTIIENKDENGKIEYSANGDLPLMDAAGAMVLIAYRAIPPKKEVISSQETPKSGQ